MTRPCPEIPTHPTADEMIVYGPTEEFVPQEIAHRQLGGTWKRRTLKTEAAFDRFIDKLNDDAAEWYNRDAD